MVSGVWDRDRKEAGRAHKKAERGEKKGEQQCMHDWNPKQEDKGTATQQVAHQGIQECFLK